MSTPFPFRGQKKPQYWDEQLQAYIDEAPAVQLADPDSDFASDMNGRFATTAPRPLNAHQQFGVLIGSGANQSTALQAALTAASAAKAQLELAPGVYLADNLTLGSAAKVKGLSGGMSRFGVSGFGGVVIKHVAGSTNPLLSVAGNGASMEDLVLDGNAASGTGLVINGFETTLERVRVINSAGYGLRIQQDNNTRYHDVLVDNCGSSSLAAVSVKSTPPGTTNTLDINGLHIERSANTALDVAYGADPTTNYAEFLRIIGLHVEAPADHGGVANVAPLVRLGNIRSVELVTPFIYGGAGPLLTHEYQAGVGNPMGGVRVLGGSLLGRTPTTGSTPDYLVRLVAGNGISFIGTWFDMCNIAAVLIDSGYGYDVYFDSACQFTSRVPAAVVDNRSGRSTYTTRGFQAVEQDLTVGRHVLNNGGALTGTAVSSGTGTPGLQNLTACNDRRGKVFFGSGATPAAGQAVAILTFKNPYAVAPYVQVNAANAASAALGSYYASVTTTTMTIFCSGTMAASQAGSTYQVTYTVEG